jgi:hypothetical protein
LRAGDDSTDYLNSSSPSEASGFWSNTSDEDGGGDDDDDDDDDDENLYVPSLTVDQSPCPTFSRKK